MNREIDNCHTILLRVINHSEIVLQKITDEVVKIKKVQFRNARKNCNIVLGVLHLPYSVNEKDYDL